LPKIPNGRGSGHFGRESHPAWRPGQAEEWASKNLTKCHKEALHLGKHDAGAGHRLGCVQLGSSSVGRDLGVLVGNKLNTSDQCAAAATQAGRATGAVPPLYSVPARPRLQ